MKLKFTRTNVIIGTVITFIAMLFLNFWLFSDGTKIFNDTTKSYGGADFGWIHMSINAIALMGIVILVIYILVKCMDDECPFDFLYDKDKNKYSRDEEKNEKQPISFNWKRWLKYAILIIIILYGFKFCNIIYKQSVFLYNTCKLYHNAYQQKMEEKQGFYDKLWKTYLQKEKITNINKETFLTVTKIIMENRRDGKNIMWKWLTENQQIPYSEFTKFYADLSNFIAEQREGYFSIEKTCQTIANQNNTLLDTFPNNVYNKVLKLQRIKFEYGFLSDSTENVFTRKKENIK
jgi:hypothetical protein